ncbi:MAG: hypothetical protein GXY77_11475 [Fibrobacter sp.]|nr:hypothetical protein [Fibrobacter sp.]
MIQFCSSVVPDIFAEYGSKTVSGSLVDLSNRRTKYTIDGKTVTLNPVLSATEASQYTVNNVLSGNDNWQPEIYTKQMRSPVVSLSDSTLKWNDNDSALCWIIFRDNKFYKCVTSNNCKITSGSGKYTVRAANAMGGLGSVSNNIDAANTQYNLTITVAKDQGTVTPEGGSYSDGQNVTLTASPNEGWIFDHWGGDLSGNSNPLTVNMNDDKSVTAYFVEDTRQYFSVVTQATPGGSITQIPEGSKIVQNMTLTLIASSNNAWTFNKWSGDYTGTDSFCTISSLNNDLTVTATFVPLDLFIYEAEYAVLNNSVQENKNAGFSGSAYVNFDNETGSSAKLPVYVHNAGERGVSIIFSNGSGVSRTMSISVNGSEQISSIEFEATTDWTTWQSKNITLALNKEYNTITLTSTDDQGGPNIDKLILDRDTSAIINTESEIKKGLYFSFRNRVLCIYAAESEMVKIRIFSLNGKLVLSKNINTISGAEKIELN